MTNQPLSTKRVLLTSFFVDVLDVVVNTVIAIITGSVVMLAETLQGLADLTSVGMLLIGFKRSQKRSSKKHPFGYGKKQYFWAIMATFLIIGVTATLSFYFGLKEFLSPDKVDHIALAYGALVISVCTNSYALSLSIRKLIGDKPLRTLPRVFVESSSVVPRTTVVLDAMGTLAALFGLTALVTYSLTNITRFDGVGAMIISVVLFVLALVLLFTTKGLVTGRSASKDIELAINNAAMQVVQVKKVLDLKSMMMGSDNLLVNIEVHLQDDLTTDEIEVIIDTIKQRIKDAVPGKVKVDVNVEPETPLK